MNKVKEKTTSLLVQHRQQSLASFSSIEHRLEVVREMNDVLWLMIQSLLIWEPPVSH